MTYLFSIFIVLLVPSCVLGVRLRSLVRWPALATALSAISVVGAAWSSVVTAHDWWSFGTAHVIGWRPLPHLLVEEVLFYPAGGALCILLYLAFAQRPVRPQSVIYLGYLLAGTVALGTVALLRADQRPYYLYSQLLVYNLLVCGGLASTAAHRIDLRGLAVTTGLMTTVGFIWDHVAFVGGWWQYHAVTHWRFGVVPVDDFAFFLFAPAAAISVYTVTSSLQLRRLFILASDLTRTGRLARHGMASLYTSK